MRTRNATKNTVINLLLHIALVVYGFLVPRFFIEFYGSDINGLVSSIGQFISYMTLVEAGIGAAGMASLYKPIVDCNVKKISGIVSAARRFYFQSGTIFAGLVIALIIVYPSLISGEIQDKGFIRLFIIVLSINGLVDYLYLGKYRMLLMADQKGFVISGCHLIQTIVLTAVLILMMKMGFSAIAVKIMTAFMYILMSGIIGLYVKKQYPDIDFRAEADKASFSQRWAALVHQISGMVVNNTDLILLTLFLTTGALTEVSVYATYNLVTVAIYGVITAITSGIIASFGDLISRDNEEAFINNYCAFELLMFIIVFATYTCMFILMYPFMTLYSINFADAILYPRQSLVILFTVTGFCTCIRMPAHTIINAAGHYDKTKWRAIIEAVANLIISLVLVRPLGIVGVMIGTLISQVYRSTDVILYTASRFAKKSLMTTVYRLVRNSVISVLFVIICLKVIDYNITDWTEWFLAGVVCFGALLLLLVALNGLFEREVLCYLVGKIKDIRA